MLPVLAVLIGGCDHGKGVPPTPGRSGVLTVVLRIPGATEASLPLHLVVRDSRGRRVGEAPLSNPRGWSFRLRTGAYRVVIVDGCLRLVHLRPRAHLWLAVVLRESSCRIRGGAVPYAGLTRSEALRVTVRRVIRRDYGGDGPLFYRNLWDKQMRRTREAAGPRAWLVKFYDAQALRSSCAYAWRGVELWAHVHLAPCANTLFGAGKPR